MLIKIFIISVFLILNIISVYGDFNSLSLEDKQCLEILNDSGFQIKNNYVSTNSGYTTNDGLTGVDYIGKNIFKIKSFNYGQKSQISKKDIFRYHDLIGVDLSNFYFYENELNFYRIETEDKKEFLSCALFINKNLKGSLSNLKKGDANIVYTTTPDKLELEIIEKNNKKYKKIISTTYFKDFYGRENILQIDKIYIIPENINLNNYYDLYNLSNKYKEIVDWFKLKIDNTDRNAHFLREIYNKDGLMLKIYYVGNEHIIDPYGMRYRFINGYSFMDEFANYKKHHIFEYMVNDKSPLSKNIVIVLNKWNRENKTYGTLSDIYWIKYFLGENKEIPRDEIDIVPYFTHERIILDNSFYKVSNLFKNNKEDYANYMYNNVYNNENFSNLDKLFSVLESKVIVGNFKELKEKTENFYKEYESIKNSTNIKEKEKFVKKYINDYRNNQIFQDESLKQISINLNSKNNDTTISDNGTNIENKYKENKNKLLLIIGLIIIVFLGFIFFKRKKK